MTDQSDSLSRDSELGKAKRMSPSAVAMEADRLKGKDGTTRNGQENVS